jgi:hypothetical protein
MKQLLTAVFFFLSMSASAQDKPGTRDIINSFLTELLEFSKDAGAFAKEQVPLVLQEYIAWGVASSVVWMLPFLVMLFFIARVWKWALREAEGSDGFSVAAAIVYTVVMLPGIIYNLLDLTKAIVAPRVYLIETLTDLIR